MIMTQKRLSKPQPKGFVIVPTGQEISYDLFYMLGQVENALELAGAKPGEDYKFLDLLSGAIELNKQQESTKALNRIASALQSLGVGNAATSMGAIELLSLSVKEGLSGLISAIEMTVTTLDD